MQLKKTDLLLHGVLHGRHSFLPAARQGISGF